MSDVWSSADGLNWSQETANAAFLRQADHQALVFNDKLWVIATGEYRLNINGVWSSDDGIDWRLGLAGDFVFE